MPETRSPYAGLAIAHGTGEPGALAMVDDALASSPSMGVAAAPAKPRPATQRSLLAKADPSPLNQSAPQPAAALPVASQPLAFATPPTNAGDEQRYAQRETQSQKQRDFRGGDAIVISASALVIILLVVILVLLLT